MMLKLALLVILAAASQGCLGTSRAAITVTDRGVPLAEATTALESSLARGPPVITFEGLGALTLKGDGCVLVVHRPRFGPFRYAAPHCAVSVEEERMCIAEVVLSDELAAADGLPTSLRLAGCAQRVRPPVVVAPVELPPQPHKVCEPAALAAWLAGDRPIVNITVLSSSVAMDVERDADGEWRLCHWGFAMDRNTMNLEITFEDGSTSTVQSSRHTID